MTRETRTAKHALRSKDWLNAVQAIDPSFQLARLNAAEITCMKFNAGDHESVIGPSEHSMLVLSTQKTNGTLYSNLSGERQKTHIRSGSLTFVPRNVVQQYDFRGRLTNIALLIENRLFERVSAMDPSLFKPDCLDVRVGWTRPAIGLLIEEQHRALAMNEAGSRVLAESIALRLAYELLSAFGGESTTPEAIPLTDTEMARLIDFIEEQMEQNFDLSDLAAQLDRDPFGFSRSFKEATGMSPHQYVIQRRVMRVKDLLQSTSDPLSEISYATGFANQPHMTSTFSKHVGMSPGRWRKTMQGRKLRASM